MIAGSSGVELSEGSKTNQSFGALIVAGILVLWIGRGHWLYIGRQMVRGQRPNEPAGTYFPYSLVGWGFVACVLGLVAWLVLAGASIVGAVVLVGMLFLIYIVLARVVAETGVLYVLVPVPLTQPMQVAGQLMSDGVQGSTTLGSYFWGRFFSGVLTHDLREALPPYAMHAMRVYEPTLASNDAKRSSPRSFFLCLVIALLGAYLVSGMSSLYIHYSYSSSIDRAAETPLESWGTWNMPSEMTLDPSVRFSQGRAPVTSTGNPFAQAGLGVGIATLLSVLSLRYAAWPLHPFGYLLSFTWGIQQTWFSLFLGWLSKTLVLRIGGASLYRHARVAFLGLVFGEVWAIGFWMIVALVHAWNGSDFHAIHVLP